MEKKTTMTLEESIHNYTIDAYYYSKARVLEKLKKTLFETGDSYESLDIRIESLEDYIKSNKTFGDVKFNAWSEKYVYVQGTYEGSIWVVAIERNPSDNLNKPIGGG